MPEQAIIDGFKGVIDFYVWMGIPCARRWPRKRYPPPTTAEVQQNEIFAIGASLWSQLSAAVQEAYNQMAVDTNLTGRDLFMRGYISGTIVDTIPVDDWEG